MATLYFLSNVNNQGQSRHSFFSKLFSHVPSVHYTDIVNNLHPVIYDIEP